MNARDLSVWSEHAPGAYAAQPSRGGRPQDRAHQPSYAPTEEPRKARPILLLGFVELALHHGALGIARSAGRLGVDVYDAHPGRRTRGCLSRYCRRGVRLPPDKNTEDTLARLRAFTEEHGPSVLVAVDDASAMFIGDHADALADASFLFPRQPEGLARTLASKRAMHELCREQPIPTPLSIFPSSEEEVLSCAEQMTFPVVAKRIDGSQPARAQQSGAGNRAEGAAVRERPPSVLIAANPRELLTAYEAMESPLEPNVMLQEYVPGRPDTIWMFNRSLDADSECKVGFTGRKLRQSPPYTGMTTLGVCVTNATVEQHTKRLAKALGYRGILDIGYRFDARDGQYKLLDVNPRIGTTFRLFVDASGMDVLRAMYFDFTGRPVPEAHTQDGRRWLVEPRDLRSSLVYLRRGDITLGEWARSFRHVQETAWLSWKDPRPAVKMLALLLLDRLRRAAARGAARGPARVQADE